MSLLLLLFLQVIYCSVGYSYEVEDSVKADYYEVEGFVEDCFYGDEGSICENRLQSPIRLPKTYIRSNFGKFSFSSNSQKKLKATLTNNGETISVRFPDKTLTISGGGLPDKYIFDSIHFHWPSEHTIEDHRFPLEGHFVYYNQKYESLQKAETDKTGVVVLGVFYQETHLCRPVFSFVSDVKTVAHNLNEPVVLKSRLSLVNLLPSNLRNYYRYNGSLTTPDFNEVVTWTVFSTPVNVCAKQLSGLTSIYNEEDEPVERNDRELQEINGRRIYFNKK